jgi:hypothetical protein
MGKAEIERGRMEDYMEIPDAYKRDWESGLDTYEADLAHERGLGDPPSLLDFDGAMKAAMQAATSTYQDELDCDGLQKSQWFLAGWMAGWFMQYLSLEAVTQ